MNIQAVLKVGQKVINMFNNQKGEVYRDDGERVVVVYKNNIVYPTHKEYLAPIAKETYERQD